MLRVFFRVCMALGGAFAVLLAACTVMSYAHAAGPDGLAVTYVPKDVLAEDMYVPVDLVEPGKKAPDQVQALMAELKQELGEHLMPIPNQYSREHLAKCEVMALLDRQTKKDSAPEPYFRVECVSAPLWTGDKGHHLRVKVLRTTIEAVVVLKSFSRAHNARVSDSVTRRTVNLRTLGS
jgi:hypothetical protein